MAKITLKGNPVNTLGDLPTVGSTAQEFTLTRQDLKEAKLGDYGGKLKVLNIFPSVDTATCALSVRQFVQKAASLPDTVVLNISADLPFAQKRFCAAEGIANAETLSSFRSRFAKDWKLEMTDGPLAGLCSRAVVVLDEQNKVLYTEQVGDIVNEPNYEKALQSLNRK